MYIRAEVWKALPKVGLVFTLLFSVFAGGLFVNQAEANPNPFQTHGIYAGDVPPPENAKPPAILLLSPRNQSYHSTNNVIFTINVSLSGSPLQYSTIYGAGEPSTVYVYPRLKEIYFEAEWQQTNTHVEPNQTILLNLAGIPEGKRSITVYAVEWRPYQILNTSKYGLGKLMYYNGFVITGSSVINFTIDTTAPIVSFLSSENMTYPDSKVPLNFTVNESVSRISYVLDGRDTFAIGGNTTVYGLPNGMHNVTVYAWDMAGNMGASEALSFTVAKPEPFPTSFVAAASGVSAFLVGLSLLFYFNKRRASRA